MHGRAERRSRRAATETSTGRRNPARDDLYAFFRQTIEDLQRQERYGTARNYVNTLRSFSCFLKGKPLRFRKMDDRLLLGYQTWLQSRGTTRNTSSFYMRILRAVYRKAAAAGLAPDGDPFTAVYTGVDQTRKRALEGSIVRRLKALDLHPGSAQEFARDLFLLSLYMRGMAFVDMAYLKKSDLRAETISYNRRKTGVMLHVRIEPCIRSLLDRYRNSDPKSPYLLPIIRSSHPPTAYREYHSGLSAYNRQLKYLAGLLGTEVALTSYMSRHTWATTARNRCIPLSVISAGMGHSSESVTRIYLDSLDNSIIDRANRKILALF